MAISRLMLPDAGSSWLKDFLNRDDGLTFLVSQGSKLRTVNSHTAHFSEVKFKKCSQQSLLEQ